MEITVNRENTLPAQKEFAFCSPEEHRHPAIVGGFGSGKTAGIPLRWLNLIFWRARTQSQITKIMIIEPTKEMIRDILIETLDKFFDNYKIPHSYKVQAGYYIIKVNGTYFKAMLRSYDNPNSLTGKNLTDIIIDEYDKCGIIQKQKDIWKECISRVREAKYGTVALVTTPEGFRNTYNLYSKNIIKRIIADTRDNIFLPKDYIENMLSQFDEQLVKQYICGEFVNITSGLVYYNFKRVQHTKEIRINTNALHISFDFNVNPMTTSISQIRNGNSITEQEKVIEVIKAINTKNSNTQTQCRIIKEYLNSINYQGTIIIYGDATGRQRHSDSNKSNWEIIKEQFPSAIYEVGVSNPAIQDRVNAVNCKMLNSKNKIGLYINTNGCDELIKDFEQIIYKQNTNVIDSSNPERTHNSDNLGYMIEKLFPITGKPIVTITNGR